MINNKVALITGITGQDGSYLAELLLEKGYLVHGLKRRSSSLNTSRIDHLYQDPHEKDQNFFLHYGDLIDSTNILKIIENVQPDEIYNLGVRILRFKFGPNKYLRKELLWPYLDHLTEKLISFYKKNKKPNYIHAHYADAGYVGVKLSKSLNVPLIFTGHSLGREKKRKLLDTGLKNNQIEKLYSIRKRIE